jgi:lysophospholipase L1-like esterase
MLARAAAVLTVSLGLIDLAARAAAWRYRLDERSIDIQSRDALRAKAATLGRRDGATQVAFLGPSLVFGQHLESAHGARWPEHTLAAQYARAGRGERAVNLGVNGLLFDELDCVATEALARRPSVVFVYVSPRPFAGDFAAEGDPGEARADRGLCLDARRPLDRLAAPLRDAAFDRFAVLHYRDLAQFSLLAAPPRVAAATALRRLLGLASADAAPAPTPPPSAAPPSAAPPSGGWDEPASAEEAAVLREMAWRIRAARRYDSIEVSPRHPQAAALRSLVERLGRAAPTRAVLFYVEEDMDRLGDQADVPHFERQRDTFIAMVEGLARSRSVPFRVIRRGEIGPHYVDHVHLDSEGYQRLAGLLRQAAGTPAR